MKVLLPAVLFVSCAAMLPEAGAADKPTTSYAGVCSDASLRRLVPEGGYVVDQQVWAKLWQAWRPKEKPPAVDWKQDFVLVETVDGPNRMMGSPTLDDEGAVQFLAAATRMAGPGFGYLMAVFPREGVKTVRGKQFAPGPQAAATGTITIPASVATFDDRLLEVRLYKIHPLLADASADLVEKLEVKKFGHEQGTDTNVHFVVGAGEKLDPKQSYYLTVFVLQDGRRTHMGETAEKRLCRVLTQGKPVDVKFVVREVGR